MHRWIDSVGLESASYGRHSMRRTKATQIYRKTCNLRAVQILLGHTELQSTVLYLGIEVDDALHIARSSFSYRIRHRLRGRLGAEGRR
jgi:site-specific recombinase XerC